MAAILIFNFMAINVFAGDVAVLLSKDIEPYHQAFTGFKQSCKNKYTLYNMNGNMEEGQRLTGKIRSFKPKLVLAIGTQAAIVAKQNLKDVPIVFCMVFNPEHYGLSSKNITGVSLNVPVANQLVTLLQFVPKLKRVGVIYNKKKTGNLISEASEMAKRFNIRLVTAKVDSEKDVPKALRKLIGKIDVLWLVNDATVVNNESFRYILLLTLENRVPLMVFFENFVKAGALVGLSPDFCQAGNQAGEMSNRILSGKSPSDCQIEPPIFVRLAVNLKTARNIGLKVPEKAIEAANKVYN